MLLPTSPEGYRLLHDGSLCLAEIERNGMRIDVEYCRKTIDDIGDTIDRDERSLGKSELFRKWKSFAGGKFNMDSNEQLANFLFGKMKLKPAELTEKGKPSTDASALEKINLPEITRLLALRKLKKSRVTMRGILRETTRGVLHPNYNLNIPRTYRSSANDPNSQNFPVRDPEQSTLVRSAVIPREGNQLMEIDYSGNEIKAGACYHHDPNMLTYVKDKTTDMHRDLAMDCYRIKQSQVTKEIRYCAKNKFVFPEFYGDYWKNCAKNLWEAIDKMDLVCCDMTPVKGNLAEHGIKNLPAFERHIERVEKHFWNKRFPVYTNWKEEHYNLYLRRGYITLLTGFRCVDAMTRNDCINYPIQGSAFHWLLWSLIRMQKLFRKHHLKTKLIGQIHDSAILDLVPAEKDIVKDICRQVMIHDLPKHWSWICVPLEVEIEIAPVNASWAKKAKEKEEKAA